MGGVVCVVVLDSRHIMHVIPTHNKKRGKKKKKSLAQKMQFYWSNGVRGEIGQVEGQFFRPAEIFYFAIFVWHWTVGKENWTKLIGFQLVWVGRFSVSSNLLKTKQVKEKKTYFPLFSHIFSAPKCQALSKHNKIY